MAFSPDGKLLGHTGWDCGCGTRSPGRPSALPFGPPIHLRSPDGKLLATADGDGAVRLSSATGKLPARPLPAVAGGVNGVAFSPDSTLLASADNDGTVRLWNLATRQAPGAPLPAETGSGAHVFGVVQPPHGKLLATADGDGTVRLWNPATSKRQASCPE